MGSPKTFFRWPHWPPRCLGDVPWRVATFGADAIPFVSLEGVTQVFLGSGCDASNLEKLQTNAVGRVLNVADDVPNFHVDVGINYCRLEIADFGAEAILHEDGIRRVFGVARDFVLENAPDPKRPNILVHCANGSNRSVTVVLALLLLLDGCSLRTAWQTVKSRRNCAMPLRDNRVALVEFEKEVCGRSSMREGDFESVT